MTTIQFPDVSTYTQVSLAGAPCVVARATIGGSRDSYYSTFRADASNRKIPFAAYHFLNAGSLGMSATAQADFCLSVVGTGTPIMLDHEPNRGACATLGEALTFIDRVRAQGGICNFHYLPRWAWSNPSGSNGLGSPSLLSLVSRGMRLVTSNYTTYSDIGPGWTPYGGFPSVFEWQYSSTHSFNGGSVDWNAFRGTSADWWTAITQGGNPMAALDWTDTVHSPTGSDRTLAQWYADVYAVLLLNQTGWGPLWGSSPMYVMQHQLADALGQIAAVSAAVQTLATSLVNNQTAVTPAELKDIMDQARTAARAEALADVHAALAAAEAAVPLPPEPTP